MQDLIVDESKWDGSRGGRCITDYVKTVRFKRDLTEEELTDFTTDLSNNDCPGWTPIRVRKEETGVYRFSTTMDSSD